MATHSHILAWKIPGTGESGLLPSMGLHRTRHNWPDLAAAAAVFSPEISIISWKIVYPGDYNYIRYISIGYVFGEGNGNPLPYSCLENPMDEDPGRLQSMGWQSWTGLSDFTFSFTLVLWWGSNRERFWQLDRKPMRTFRTSVFKWLEANESNNI